MIKLNIDPRQPVWVVDTVKKPGEDRIQCPLCEGAGHLMVSTKSDGTKKPRKKKIQCPRCHGDGYWIEHRYDYVPVKCYIHRIVFDDLHGKLYTYYDLSSYSCGDGFCNYRDIPDTQVYPSEAIAQAVANRRNKRKEKGK